jgi:hypothetical protein
MYKVLLLLFLLEIVSCTDQGEPFLYSIKNTSTFDLKLSIFDKSGKSDTFLINVFDSQVLDKEGPPYDNGPFSDKDSIKVIFSNNKILTYIAFKSKDDCLNSNKNPFCQYSHYKCDGNNCTFEIDEIEYLKAK